MGNFGKFIAIMLGIIISSIINGFVITKLWAWFVVPTFEANPLRIIEAIGLMFLVNHIKAKRDKEHNKDKFWEQFVADAIYLILISVFALLGGRIIQIFI